MSRDDNGFVLTCISENVVGMTNVSLQLAVLCTYISLVTGFHVSYLMVFAVANTEICQIMQLVEARNAGTFSNQGQDSQNIHADKIIFNCYLLISPLVNIILVHI